MSVYQGSLAITRYRIIGNPGKTTIASLSKLIAPYIAPRLRVDGPAKPESVGWVRPLTASDEDTVSEDSHWDMSDCHVDDSFLLRLRYERRKVPSSLVQTLYRNKIRDHLQETGKAMARAERQEFKVQLITDLTKRTLPMIQFTDGLWRQQAGELFIFTTSNSVRQRFEQLFHQTFASELDFTLLRMDGPQMFFGSETDSEAALTKQFGRINALEPAVFSPHGSL
ncbi:MAG: recombination-associated protein RdgC [Proteobacteria bacterium]|nr:recombination-associated protein RdgC [Pseudomonadota bacterium]